MDDWNLDEKALSPRQHLQHYKLIMLKFPNKEWKLMLSLQLLSVALHMRLTIRIEQKKNGIGDNECNI